MAVKKRVDSSISSFIDKGADVKSNKESSFKNILIRVHESILSELDEALEKNPGIARTQWVVQAIREKLKSDGQTS